MNEAHKRRWDVALGVIAPVLTFIGIFVGVLQFNAGERNKVIFEYQSKLWLERLQSYRDIASIAGQIVASDDPTTRKKAVQGFLSAYWGGMILVEDKQVERAMIDFYDEVNDIDTPYADMKHLKIKADALINACRASEEKGAPNL